MSENEEKQIEALNKEAERLRKDAHEQLKLARNGKLTAPKISQDYLIAQTRLLMDIASDIEGYTMSIQPIAVDIGEIKFYRDMISKLRRYLC